jgi:hypothetical protein
MCLVPGVEEGKGKAQLPYQLELDVELTRLLRFRAEWHFWGERKAQGVNGIFGGVNGLKEPRSPRSSCPRAEHRSRRAERRKNRRRGGWYHICGSALSASPDRAAGLNGF